MRSSDGISLGDLPRPESAAGVAAIAQAVEKEAERRHRALAGRLRGLGSPEVASLLERLAGEHKARAGRFEADAAAGEDETIAAIDLAALPRRIFSEDRLADCNLFDLTPYRVLAFAARLADRTFRLYSYLAASANDDLRNYLERLAGEELSRAAQLRGERRRAYHVERRKPSVHAYPAADRVESLADLLAAALAIEAALAERLATARNGQSDLSSAWQATERRVGDLRRASARAETPADLPHPERAGADADRDKATRLRRLLADCERAFTFYDAVASAPADEAVMLKAQDLSQAAVKRIRQVRNTVSP